MLPDEVFQIKKVGAENERPKKDDVEKTNKREEHRQLAERHITCKDKMRIGTDWQVGKA